MDSRIRAALLTTLLLFAPARAEALIIGAGEMLVADFQQAGPPAQAITEAEIRLRFPVNYPPFLDITVRLFDGATLLGEILSVGSAFPGNNRGFYFYDSTTPNPPPYTSAAPIDFSSFLAGTFSGRVEVELSIPGIDVHPFVRNSFTQSSFRLARRTGSGTTSLASDSPLVLGNSIVPIPEPSALLLLATVLAGAATRPRR